MSVFVGEDTPLIRTDFSDDDMWQRLLSAVEQENADGFRAWCQPIDRPDTAGQSLEEWAQLGREAHFRLLVFADARVFSGDGTLLCLNPQGPSQQFRCPIEHLWAPENNLSLANMDFEEFLSSCDPEGVFRGFG